MKKPTASYMGTPPPGRKISRVAPGLRGGIGRGCGADRRVPNWTGLSAILHIQLMPREQIKVPV
jgi:hypothetical protein